MPATQEAPPKRYTVRNRDGQVIGKAELRKVPVAAIKTDFAYQRDVDASWVDKHMPFDPHKAGAVILSGRAGGPYALDGGHRIALARGSGVAAVNAFVIEGLTQADEADLFIGYQRERRNLKAWDLYRAGLVAGEPETVAIDRLMKQAGFVPSKSGHRNPNTITAIDAVRWIYRYGGDGLLGRSLTLVRSIWFDLDGALGAPILKGLALFLASAGEQPNFRHDRLEEIMRKNGPPRVLLLAQQIGHRRRTFGGNSPANVAEALKEQYDKLTPKNEEKLGPLTIRGKKRPSAKGGVL